MAVDTVLSGGTAWLYTETLTLTASAGYFVAGDVGNAIRLTLSTTTWTPEGGWATTTSHLTVTIVAYTSTTVVSVRANKTVPVAFRGTTITIWAKGVDQFSGMGHLEGKALSILADGNVITNGIDAPFTTVVAGAFSLATPVFVMHAGLPYCADLQLLDLEVMGAETISTRQKSVNQVTLHVEASRGVFAGNDVAHLVEYKPRSLEPYGVPIAPFTGKITVSIGASWNRQGSVCVRQRDPLPLSVLNATPTLEVGG